MHDTSPINHLTHLEFRSNLARSNLGDPTTSQPVLQKSKFLGAKVAGKSLIFLKALVGHVLKVLTYIYIYDINDIFSIAMFVYQMVIGKRMEKQTRYSNLGQADDLNDHDSR